LVARTLTLVAVALAVIASACGGGKSGKAAAPTTQAPSPAPTTSTTTVESKILADLIAYNHMYTRLEENPDPVDAELSARITGKDLDVVRTYLTQLKLAHRSLRGPSNDTFHVVSIEAAKAVVDMCSHDDSHWYVNGVRQPDAPSDHTTGTEFTLVLEGGTWKVFNGVNKPSACSG
jgi:hypothetical protein